MLELWTNLSGAQQILWGLAIFFTLSFLIQIVFALLGLQEIDDDVTFFTLRNAIVFFLGFSWGGLACLDAKYSIWLAVLIGLIMVAINFLLLKGLASLNIDGNLNLDNAIGKLAVVSLSIPADGGCGKVNISFQGRWEELEAATKNEAIPTGQTVKVLQVSGNNRLIVENHS